MNLGTLNNVKLKAPKKKYESPWDITQGDCLSVLKTINAHSIDCVVTSPPYWSLRDYGVDGQIGKEVEPKEYVKKLVQVFREVKRVLKPEGTCWINIGDSYCGGHAEHSVTDEVRSKRNAKGGSSQITTKDHQFRAPKVKGVKTKDLVGIPWMLAFALRDDGWFLRSEVIWHKPNPMPESVKDRPTRSHEQIFLLTKSSKYFYDADAIREGMDGDTKRRYTKSQWNGNKKRDFPGRDQNNMDKFIGSKGAAESIEKGRNKRSVWSVNTNTRPYKDAHFAMFPPTLIEPCILAGSPKGGLVLDPFNGAATTGIVAVRNGRKYRGIELNPDYVKLSRQRLTERFTSE